MVALPAHRKPQTAYRNSQTTKLGRDALAKVNTTPHNENEADQQTGRPALYDKAIPTDYNHNLGVQKGWIGTYEVTLV